MADTNLASWNYLLGLVSPYGFGLAAAAGTTPATVSNADIKIYADGSSTASVTRTVALSTLDKQIVPIRGGYTGKDIELEITFFSIDGGRKLSSIQMDLNILKRRND